MAFSHTLIFSLILLLPGVSAYSASDPVLDLALETIDPDEVCVYISYLASDKLTGRNAGTEGNEKAALWIADCFRKLRLEPGGDDGTYLQQFTFRPRGAELDEAIAANVIGIYRGSDPVLRNEAIVVGAHFDHVGMKGHPSDPGRMGRAYKNDRIWNGADDNASGTAAVIEIAQAFALSKIKVKRSIVFILFNAEEHGLHGSYYYVKHPVFSLQDTVAMVNLDMVGRNSKHAVYLMGGDSSADNYFMDTVEQCSKRVADLEVIFGGNWFITGSDHYPFIKENIPAVFFFAGLHRDYHMVGDEASKIDCPRVANVSRVAFLMLHQMADDQERVRFNPMYRPGLKGKSKNRMLGISTGKRVPEEVLEALGLPKDQGAVRVDQVYKHTPAHGAGVKKKDLILSIGTMRIRAEEPITSLRDAIDEAPPGSEVPIEVIRSGEILELTIRWPEESGS